MTKYIGLYGVNYEDQAYGKWNAFPDSQSLVKGVDIQTAFDVAAEATARAFLSDGSLEYAQTDMAYTVTIAGEEVSQDDLTSWS